MEKATTPANRLTRSSARNTPSKKFEDSSEYNPAEELKHNLRKSRRKVETNLNSNGESSNDVEQKKLNNHDEASDGNSVDGCDSEDSNICSKQKNTPKSNKTVSPTISRRSLRVRRSITPGPELEPSVTRKLRRSTSESKLDPVHTPTRRSTRAKSESKDMFSPSRHENIDYMNTNMDTNSKSVSIISALKVIDEIIEEDSEPQSSPQKHLLMPTKPVDSSTESVLPAFVERQNHHYEKINVKTNECIGLEEDKNKEIGLLKDVKSHQDSDKYTHDQSVSEISGQFPESGEAGTDNEAVDTSKETNCLLVECVDSEISINASEQLPAIDKDDSAQDKQIPDVHISEGSSDKLPIDIGTGSPIQRSEKLTEIEEIDNAQDTTIQDGDFPKDISDKLLITVGTGSPLKLNNELPMTDSPKDTSFHRSSCGVITREVLPEELKIVLPPDDKNLPTSPMEEITSSHSQSFRENAELNDKTQIECIDIDDTDAEKELQSISFSHSICDTSKSVIDDNKEIRTEASSKLTSATGTEDISVIENNNSSLTLEVHSETESEDSIDANQSSTTKLISMDLSPSKSLLKSESKSYQDYKVAVVEESVAFSGSDSVDLVMDTCQDHCKNIGGTEVNCEPKPITTRDDHCENIETYYDGNVDNVSEREFEKNSCLSDETLVAHCNQNIQHIQQVATRDNYNDAVNNSGNSNYCSKSPKKDNKKINENNNLQGENTLHVEQISLQNNQEFSKSRSINEEITEGARQLIDSFDGHKNEEQKKTMIDQEDSNIEVPDLNQDKQTLTELTKEKENNVLGSSEDGNSASDSDLYKNMSNFGSDIEEKKGDSQYGDSVSSELRSGDSEECVSSIEGDEEQDDDIDIDDYEEEDEDDDDDDEEEEEEETNNEKNQLSNEQENCEKIINPKVAENDLDSSAPMTYDKALAIINKNRVNKIDDEEFFDMFTQELNRVSEESGSDSDIAIVDEYIAEPEEQQQTKSNQKPGNLQTNRPVRNIQKPAPPNSVQNRPMPPQGAYDKIKINLKGSQKSDSSHIPIPHNFSETYNQPDHSRINMNRMNLSQEELYHQYNQGMSNMDYNRGPYDQYSQYPTNMQDPRMYHHHMQHDNYSMHNQSLSASDADMHYLGGPSLKVRNIESMYGSHPSNMINMNSGGTELSGTNKNEDANRVNRAGVSAATMTESDDKLEQGTFSSSSKKADTIINPILEILGLDKRKLKMLKNVLGLNENGEKQRAKIKQMLFEEAQKMGLSLKIPTDLKKLKQHKSPGLSVREKARKRKLMKQVFDSDSDFYRVLVQSRSEDSSKESQSRSDESSSVSRKTETSSDSSIKNETRKRTISMEDGEVSVTIDTRPKRKRRHRAHNHFPKESIKTGKQKRRYESGESSNEESIKQFVKKKPRNRGRMTQGKKQKAKEPKVLQSKAGTFIVDPVTGTSQSESETHSQDETTVFQEAMRRKMNKELASGKNKLSNMFRQRSLTEEKKSLKRKIDVAFGQSEQMGPKLPKSKRLPADLLAKLGNEEKESKRRKKDQKTSGSEEEFMPKSRKIRKKATSKKIKVSSTAAQKEYIPLVFAGPTQFGLQRLDKDGTLTSLEKAAKFRSDNLYGASVKRITSQELMNVKKKQQRNEAAVSNIEKKKKSGKK